MMNETNICGETVTVRELMRRHSCDDQSYATTHGLFAKLKVPDGLTSYQDRVWYQHPPGTVATIANADEMRRDGPGAMSTQETNARAF